MPRGGGPKEIGGVSGPPPDNLHLDAHGVSIFWGFVLWGLSVRMCAGT